MAKVILDIREKRFFPDATRSGLFAVPAPRGKALSSASSTCSSRPSSASSLAASGDDAFDDDVAVQEEPDEPAILQCILRNDSKQSGFCHLWQEGELACGKAKPLKFSYFDEPPVGARLCAKCF